MKTEQLIREELALKRERFLEGKEQDTEELFNMSFYADLYHGVGYLSLYSLRMQIAAEEVELNEIASNGGMDYKQMLDVFRDNGVERKINNSIDLAYNIHQDYLKGLSGSFYTSKRNTKHPFDVNGLDSVKVFDYVGTINNEEGVLEVRIGGVRGNKLRKDIPLEDLSSYTYEDMMREMEDIVLEDWISVEIFKVANNYVMGY